MTWGNGNGYGNDDVYGRLNNTRDVGGARFPFIEDGRHKLAVVTLEEFQHSSDGPSARGLFLVLESNKHNVGSYVVKIWKLVKPAKFPNQATDADKFADFCRKLKNAPSGYPIGNDIRVLMRDRAREQLARGMVIECTGVPNKKGNWVETYWNAVQQTPQDIAAMRQRIEQQGVPSTSDAAPQQMPVQNQYAGAPHPSQMPQQYPAQMQQTPQQYAQPPLQNPVPQAPAAPPQGGFLAQLPPQGNGNGNQGGGW